MYSSYGDCVQDYQHRNRSTDAVCDREMECSRELVTDDYPKPFRLPYRMAMLWVEGPSYNGELKKVATPNANLKFWANCSIADGLGAFAKASNRAN